MASTVRMRVLAFVLVSCEGGGTSLLIGGDGGLDAGPDAPSQSNSDAWVCAPACDGSSLMRCKPNGLPEYVDCLANCVATPAPHCGTIPNGGNTVPNLAASPTTTTQGVLDVQ